MVANFQPTTEGVAQPQGEKPVICDILALLLKIGYLYSAVWINNWANLSIIGQEKGCRFQQEMPNKFDVSHFLSQPLHVL